MWLNQRKNDLFINLKTMTWLAWLVTFHVSVLVTSCCMEGWLCALVSLCFFMSVTSSILSMLPLIPPRSHTYTHMDCLIHNIHIRIHIDLHTHTDRRDRFVRTTSTLITRIKIMRNNYLRIMKCCSDSFMRYCILVITKYADNWGLGKQNG